MIVPIRFSYISVFAIASILISIFISRNISALTITAPTWEGSVGRSVRSRVDSDKHVDKHQQLELDLRIRSTVEGDIKKVAEILTHELLEDENERNHQYQTKLLDFKFRGTFSDVTSLLQSRMDAIQIGRSFYRKEVSILTEADRLRLLWNNEQFRTHVEKAASLSNERHFWKEHNFYCAPDSFDWLFHKMITAENAITGEVVGFCEVAMLHADVDDGDEEEECSLITSEAVAVPTIINLVTSNKYRRRGVGSTIVNSALNYARRTSSPGKTVALFVEEDNIGAIRIYKRLGFEMERKIKSTRQLYMMQQVNSIND